MSVAAELADALSDHPVYWKAVWREDAEAGFGLRVIGGPQGDESYDRLLLIGAVSEEELRELTGKVRAGEMIIPAEEWAPIEDWGEWSARNSEIWELKWDPHCDRFNTDPIGQKPDETLDEIINSPIAKRYAPEVVEAARSERRRRTAV